MSLSTLCVGADVHLDEIVLCVVDKAESHEVCERFHYLRYYFMRANTLCRFNLEYKAFYWRTYSEVSK